MPGGVKGVVAGHWTHPEAQTGCTVVLLPEGTVASGEIRGGAPGTREWALLSPERTIAEVDAVVFSGGSAFGLAACDGVARWCEERGRGVAVGPWRVPIVVGAVLFDLGVGDGAVRPGAAEGYAACQAASEGQLANGRVGAGAGATVGKWRGPGEARAAGLATAEARVDGVAVWSLAVVNAVGDVVDPPELHADVPLRWAGPALRETGGATSLLLTVTNARLDKVGCMLVAQATSTGLARSVDPVHTRFDGDAAVAGATGEVEAPVDLVCLLATRATSEAVRSSVGRAGGPAVR